MKRITICLYLLLLIGIGPATAVPVIPPGEQHVSQISTLPASRKLKDVLLDVKHLFKVDLLFDEELVDGLVSSVVVQKTDRVETVLDLLLSPVGLRYRKLKARAYVILPQSAAKPATTIEARGNANNETSMRFMGSGIEPISMPRAQAPLTPAKIIKTVTGTVTDNESREGIPGVTVLLKGKNNGTVTDTKGRYSISAEENDVLVFSYVGYLAREETVGNRIQINVNLTPDTKSLDEVVVVGYGTQKRGDVTGSIASVNADKLEKRPVATFEQALQGLAPGINVAQRSASPGSVATINIRGVGSISAGSNPLFVIDGFPTDQQNAAAISPSDIESIDILKDASATAIYGSRGANGVIIITTKSGKEGRSQINLSINTGISQIPESARIKVLNGQEYVQYYTESYTNRGLPVPDAIRNWNGVSTDWQEEVLRTAPFQNYALSASGGSDKVTFLLSGNYINQKGAVIGEDYNKYSARLKLDYKPTQKISLGLNIAPNYSVIRRGSPAPEDGGGVDWASTYSLGVLLPPILPVRNSNGSYASGSDLKFGFPLANPLELNERYKRETNLFRLLANMYASIELLPGLKVTSSLGANYGADRGKTFYNPPGVHFQLPTVSTLSLGQSQEIGWLNENTINYRKVLGNQHSFDVLAGYTLQKNSSEGLGSNVSNFSVIGPQVLSFGDTKTLTSSNGISQNSLISYLGRLNYSFKDKYLLTATVRRDGSSRFGANNRFATFGSVAAGWRISAEDFMKSLTFIDDAKIRASFGTTGSEQIPNAIARPSLRAVNQSFGSSQVQGIANADPGNQDLTWETSQQLDFGLDATLFRNRLTLVADYYRNTTTDLLLQKNLVTSSGFAGVLTNIGSMRNSGVELSATMAIINQKKFSWSVGGNVTHNNQKVLDLGGDQEMFNFFGALRTTVGGELQQIRGVKAVGVVRQGDVVPAQTGAKPGDILFEDFNKDGKIGDFLSGDGQLLGDPNLDWIYGINSRVRYGNFELSALLQGQAGGSMYDFYLLQVGADFQNTNVSKDFWYDGRYVSESQPGNGKTPRAGSILTSAGGVGTVSSLGVQSTDFLRVRNISFTYSLPNNFLSRYKISAARLYTSVENLYTFTKFIGGNPAATRNSAGGPGLIGGSRLVGDGRESSLVSSPSLPLPRTWTLGLNLTF